MRVPRTFFQSRPVLQVQRHNAFPKGWQIHYTFEIEQENVEMA